MKIHVLFFAQLKEAAGDSCLRLETREGASVEELVEKLMKGPRLAPFGRLPLLYAINESFVPKDAILSEGDTLALMTPVAGGAI